MKSKKSKKVILTLGLGNTAKGCGLLGPFPALSLQGVKNCAAIGSKVTPKELIGPGVLVLFTGPAAVSALIKDLQTALKDAANYEKSVRRVFNSKKEKEEILINAANHKPVGRTNKQRNVPRKNKLPRVYCRGSQQRG